MEVFTNVPTVATPKRNIPSVQLSHPLPVLRRFHFASLSHSNNLITMLAASTSILNLGRRPPAPLLVLIRSIDEKLPPSLGRGGVVSPRHPCSPLAHAHSQCYRDADINRATVAPSRGTLSGQNRSLRSTSFVAAPTGTCIL